MNRPYVYRGREVPGVYQRWTAKCGPDKCDRHKWQYEVELPTGPTGKRQRDTKGGFATAKEAIEARAEVLRSFKEGTYSVDPKMTLAQWLPKQWLPKWLDARIERGDLRDGTAADHRDSISRFLIPRLGVVKLAELRAAHLTAAYDAMRRDRAEEIRAVEEINAGGGGPKPQPRTRSSTPAGKESRSWCASLARSDRSRCAGSTTCCPAR